MHARIGWQNLRTSEFLDSGEYMLITGTDFQDGKIDYSKVHYVEKERYEQDKKIQISNGSILITKDGTIGKVAYVENLPMKSTLNAGVFNLTVVDDINTSNLYLYHYLKGPFLLRFVNEESTGGTIKHLNQNVLVKFPIPLPSYREQLKISVFLTNIDKLITLHQRKGLLEYSFFAKLFIIPLHKSLTNAWEQRKLNEFSEYVSSSLTVKDINENGKYDLYDANNIIGKIDKPLLDKEYISIIKDGAGVGRVRKVPENTNILGTMGALTPQNGDYNFLFSILEKTDFTKLTSGGTIPHIYFKQYGEEKFFIPSILEQQTIGKYFDNLDNLITLHQRTHFSIQY